MSEETEVGVPLHPAFFDKGEVVISVTEGNIRHIRMGLVENGGFALGFVGRETYEEAAIVSLSRRVASQLAVVLTKAISNDTSNDPPIAIRPGDGPDPSTCEFLFYRDPGETHS